jgi:hypothetical protein
MFDVEFIAQTAILVALGWYVWRQNGLREWDLLDWIIIMMFLAIPVNLVMKLAQFINMGK